jgi:3-oxoacyl-[acyl-carrier protein] reductase
VELAAQLVVFLASDASNGLTGKLISAPHDAWHSWQARDFARLAEGPWYTLRRMDERALRALGGEFR